MRVAHLLLSCCVPYLEKNGIISNFDSLCSEGSSIEIVMIFQLSSVKIAFNESRNIYAAGKSKWLSWF